MPRAIKRKIMKGDRVKVIRGNFRDMEGSVLEVVGDGSRVRVEGVNQRKRHTRPSQKDPDGGIISMIAPIHNNAPVRALRTSAIGSRRTSETLGGSWERTVVTVFRPLSDCPSKLANAAAKIKNGNNASSPR